MRDERGIVGGILLIGVVCGAAAVLPGAGLAQVIQGIPRSPIETGVTAAGERMPEGVYVMPWIAGGVVYDDNVFFSVQGRRQDDVFLRVTPGLQASYQSSPFTVIGNYRFDSEVYNRFTDLNAAQQRQFGTVETRWRPSTHWNVANQIGFAQTNTPFELNVLTAAQSARFRTERYFVNPSAEYRPDSLTRMSGQYAFAKDIFAGEIEINSHIFNLAADRRIGSHDTLGPAYVGRYFTFGIEPGGAFTGSFAGDPGDFQSHALMLAWGHDFSADSRLDVRVGPRLTQGKLDDRPEAYVGIRKRIQNGDVGLTYTSAITTIIGTVGGTQADTLALSLNYQPVRHLTFTVSPAASWIRSSSFDATVYAAYVEGAYQFNKYVTAKASAYFSYQEGAFVTVGGVSAANAVVARNVYWLRVEFTYPSRWE
jgi:hypothetical protein